MDAAIIEFDSLPDANRAAADDDDTLLVRGFEVGGVIDAGGCAAALVSGVIIWREGGEFGSAGIDHTETRMNRKRVTSSHHSVFTLTLIQ